MPEVIKLRKGLDIKLKGTAAKELVPVKASAQYALVPDDFTGVTPKVVVSEGQIVKAGEALFVDKKHPEVKFVSPVSGTVVAVNRGARRKVMSIVVAADGKQEFVDFGVKSVHSLNGEQVKQALMESANIFTGGHNFHSRKEWLSLNQMVKSAEIIYNLLCF